jgi:hypothetical protein
MPRYGKIHSMPAALPDGASERLQQGKTEEEVADWLNQTLKTANIRGLEPDVTQKNVNAWHRSGYMRWLEMQRAKDLAKRITEIKESADPTTPDSADALAQALIAELAIELAVIKENYEPGEERTKRLLSIVAGVIQLRRTNQAKGWLKIEVAKTKMTLSRFQQENEDQERDLEDLQFGKREAGISPETMKQIEAITGLGDDDDVEYDTMSEKEVQAAKAQAREDMKQL